MMETLSKAQIAAAFNEWMRRYIEEPERFERELLCVRAFENETLHGHAPSYGTECADYILQIAGELAAK
jgi:hypothetical protein